MLSLGSVLNVVSTVKVTGSSSVLLCFPEHLPRAALASAARVRGRRGLRLRDQTPYPDLLSQLPALPPTVLCRAG